MKICNTFLILLCLAFSSLSTASEHRLLVFGDSLSAAYNLKKEQGWVSLLATKLQAEFPELKVINASISGETTAGGLARFANQINQSKPNIVLLELGGNDGLRGFDLNTTEKNLKEMVDMSISSGAEVLLAEMQIPPNYGRTYTRKFQSIYQNLAKNDKVTLLPFLLEGVATNAKLMQRDGIHPNEKGQPIIAENVLPHLSQLIKKQK